MNEDALLGVHPALVEAEVIAQGSGYATIRVNRSVDKRHQRIIGNRLARIHGVGEPLKNHYNTQGGTCLFFYKADWIITSN